MNVFLQKLIFYLSVLFIPTGVFAQIEHYEVLPTETFEYEFTSANSFNYVYSDENDGIPITAIGNNTYRINYTPKSGFFGVDLVTIQFRSSPYNQKQFKTIEIEVIASRVIAEDDHATISSDVPWLAIPVLDNDYGSRGNLSISNISVTNNGTVYPAGGQVWFVPDEGFKGLASFNYVVCDDIGTCAIATVTVTVEGNSVPDESQNIKLITALNTALPIFLPFELETIDSEAQHGTLTSINGNRMEYMPANGYFGADSFTVTGYHSSGALIYLTYEIDVLFKTIPNTIAFDDFAYTPINKPVEIEVLQNDIGEYVVASFSAGSTNGIVEKLNNQGKFLFTPSPDFTGKTSFTYTVKSPTGFTELEEASVYIQVKDQVPTSLSELTTPKNVPLLIKYIVPVSGFSFNVVRQPDNGRVNAYQGYQEVESLGYTIQDEDFILFEPNLEFVGTDQFELEYCISGNCTLLKISVEVQDIQIPGNSICADFNCIWPGDANNDGVVNMGDLIQLGLHIGTRGVARDDKNLDWYGHYGEDWNDPYARSTVDLKYTDADGNGFLAAPDTTSISRCYGLQHNLTAPAEPFLLNLPFYLEPTTDSAEPGDLVEFNIRIGTQENPAYDLYGFDFNFQYNPRFVNSESVEINFLSNAWTAYGSPILSMTKKPYQGKIDAGYTRTNKIAKDGYGIIGTVKFVVDDDIHGFRLDDEIVTSLKIGNSGTTDGAGNSFNIPGSEIDLKITRPQYEEELTDDKLFVYPNPARDQLSIHLNGQNEVEQLLIYSITGQEVYNSGQVGYKHNSIDVSQLSNGTYIVKALTTKGVVAKKIEVVK